MKRFLRLGLTAVLLAVMLLAILPASSIFASSRYEYYITGEDGERTAYGNYWTAQSFTPQVTHNIESVKLLLYRMGSPGTTTISIRDVVGGDPYFGEDKAIMTFDGNSLSSNSDGEWKELVFDVPYEVEADVIYGIVVRCVGVDADNSVRWRCDSSSPTYNRGTMWNGHDAGWHFIEDATSDFLFEEWGQGSISAPEAQTNEATGVGYNEGPMWFEATLNGLVVDDGGEPCEAGFDYRIKGSGDFHLGGGAVGEYETDETFEITLINLLSETTYEFRACVANSEDIGYGEILEFTTEWVISEPLVITYGYPIILGDYDCRIYGGIGRDGGSLCDAWFEWRELGEETWIEQGDTQLVRSAGFELPDPLGDWARSGSGSSHSLSTTQVHSGTYSVELTYGGSSCMLYQSLETDYIRYQGEKVSVGVWVWSSTATDTRISVADGVGTSYSAYHTGSSDWEFLKVTRAVDAGATGLEWQLNQYDSTAPVYFDDVVGVRGSIVSGTETLGEWLETGEGANTLVTGLDQLMWYEYRMLAENDEGIGSGGIASFILYGDLGEPVVRTDGTKFLKDTSVWLCGTLIDDGGDGEGPGCWVGFEWRKVGSGKWLDTGACGNLYSGEDWSTDIVNLQPETNYEYRAWARQSVLHSEYVYGEIKVLYMLETFRTPVVRTREAEYVDSVTLRLCGSLDYDGGHESSVWFQYRLLGDSSWTETVKVDGVPTGYDVETLIFHLKTGFYYEYRALASNVLGIGYGGVMSTCVVAEEADPQPPKPFDPLGGIEKWLARFGLNNAGGHFILLILGMAICFGIFYVSKALRVIVPLLVFAVAIAVGWIELWIIILLALSAGLMLFGLLRKQVSGGE